MLSRISHITGARLFFIPVQTRVPLKFGRETLTSVTCARVAIKVADATGRAATGWGETPLSVQWVWPSSVPYARRHEALKRFCVDLTSAWMSFQREGHAIELGWQFQEEVLPSLLAKFNAEEGRGSAGPLPAPREKGAAPVENGQMPWLAALACNSPFDIALHDALGNLAKKPIYALYGGDSMALDLARFLEPANDSAISFRGRFPSDYLEPTPAVELPAWHLVGGLDALDPRDLTGNEPNDGHPVVLTDWIERDGLKCLKVKLRGNDSDWDYERLVRVGQIARAKQVEWLTADFNCTVNDPAYVSEILEQLHFHHPQLYDMLLYVEQPFPYDLERHRIDVHSVSARKPLFLDESAHDWRMIRLGRELGWTGVALKTCKTQTGALLSACWAKAHGMALMVQDLTNPMLAQVPHALLAMHAGTIMGVETNAMQFYPEASAPEARVHPGLYRRRNGKIDLSTICGAGFGYRLDEIDRTLPPPAAEHRLD